jgi:hypothetical protein
VVLPETEFDQAPERAISSSHPGFGHPAGNPAMTRVFSYNLGLYSLAENLLDKTL